MKENLWRGVTDRTERVIAVKRARDDAMNTLRSSRISIRGRRVVGSAEEEAGDDRSFALAGLFDYVDGEDDVSSRERTPRQEAETSYPNYKALKIPFDFAKSYSGHSACWVWAEHGNLAPQMKHVAQALLGMPPLSAVLGCDFCIAGQVILRKRGALDPAIIDRLRFLGAEYEQIRQEIRPLNEVEARAAIQERLKDVARLKEVQPLEADPSATGSSDEPKVMINEKQDVSDNEEDDSDDEEDGCRRKK